MSTSLHVLRGPPPLRILLYRSTNESPSSDSLISDAGDEMFADSYPMREIQDGFFYEVDGKVRGCNTWLFVSV